MYVQESLEADINLKPEFFARILLRLELIFLHHPIKSFLSLERAKYIDE